MLKESKSIFTEFISLIKSKFLLYSAFFTLWTVFLMYNNNFFIPMPFWMVFSAIALFLVPVYFVISVEEKNIILKSVFTALFLITLVMAFYLIGLKGVKRNILSNEILSGAVISMFIPLILYMIFKKRFFLSDYGLSFGNVKMSAVATAASILVMVPVILIIAKNPQFKHVYPLFKNMRTSNLAFVQYECAFFFFFILWEFFFRGIMLFSLIKSSDKVLMPILVQAVIFTFAHLGKPGIETVSSLLGGFILGFLIYRLKTFLPAAIIHFSIAFMMDLLAVYF